MIFILDMIYKKYPSDVVYLATGAQLNKVLWCVKHVKKMYNEQEDGYEYLSNLEEELSNKPSYEELLDSLGIPKAPSEDEVTWVEFLNKNGLTPPHRFKK